MRSFLARVKFEAGYDQQFLSVYWAHGMEQLGKYRIEAKLGEGAMGFVYKAWHPGFNDYVALKTIQDTRLEGKELLDRFKLEGQALAKLKHQNIVQIYDAGQASGVHFIVMEYMNGGSLDRIISRRDASVPLAKRVSYMVPVCNALDYAHKKRLYHRDIKPANIMLHIDGGEEIVKIVDFGIARLVDSSQTQTKLLIGAPAYMAPELVTAMSKANEKTDIWALGVTLYELITYQRPFEGNSIGELTRNIVNSQPKPLTQIAPDCPKDLCVVVEKTLQKDPTARYQSVEALLLDLEPIARRLRIDFAGNLVRRAKELIEVEEFETAKSALDEAKKYHATNLEVRSLLQQVEDELRRGQLLPRLQEQVRVGRNFLTNGQYREAKAAAEQAIGLDSRYEPAHKLMEEIQSAEALAEEIQQKMTYAKRYVTEGELTQASKLVEDVLGIDPDNREASELSAKIRARREELERRKKLSQFLRSADELLYTAKYEECLSLISEALREFPGNAELQKRKDNAQSEKGEQERLLLLNSARKLRTSQRFDEALEVLDELLIRFPGDTAGTTLRASIQKEHDQEHLSKQLGQAWEDLRSLKIQGKIPEALALAKDLARKFPSEERIKEFVRELEAEVREIQLHNQLDATTKKIQELTRNGKFTQAIIEGEEALKQFPKNSLLVSLHKEAKAQGQREELLKRQANCLGRARDLVTAGQFKEAAELARKGLAEYGEHSGLREVIAEAGRHEPLQVRQQEAVATRIQESCDKGDFGLATRIFQDARKEGLIEENSPLHQTLLQHIEKAKDPGQKENAEQIELKRPEDRQATDRKAPPPKEPLPVEPAPRSAVPGPAAGKKWIIGAVGAAVLALVVIGAIVLRRIVIHHPKDNDEVFWNNAEAAMSRSPRDFKEALAQYEKVSELEGAHREQAHAKIHDIKVLQDEEEKLLQQAQQSLDKSPPDYPTAIGLYDQIIKIEGDRKADAEALLNRAEDLSKGLDIMVRAQQDFDSAEKLAATGKWVDARKQYDLVRKTPGISDELRADANAGFKKSDLHAKEEEFWKRAIAAENGKQLLDARGLFITVIGLGLNHKKDAESHIKEIDRELAEAEAERKWAELKARFEQSRDSRDRNVLIGLRTDLGAIISGGGPHSGDAREYDRVVADTLARLDAEEEWRRISDLYKQALSANDRASLIQIGERLKPFLNGGAHAEEARQYTENINRITSRPTLAPSKADKSAIEQIAGQYAHDIQHKKVKDIKKIWPGISKEMEDQLQQFANAHKIHSLEIHVEKLEPYSSGLMASCQEDMDYEEDGKRLKRSSQIDFYMVKIQGNWKINGILVAKH